VALRRRPRKAEPEDQLGSGELNIVPFLDVVVNLMLFLLATSTAAMAVAQVEVEMPAFGPRCVGCPPASELELSLTLADEGIVVAGRGGRLSPGCEATGGEVLTVPRAGARHDFAELTRCLERVHAEYPHEDTVIITADPRVPYEELIHAMDAARGTSAAPLFPHVLLSAGVR
jgi:biopolymer transport protein TolR